MLRKIFGRLFTTILLVASLALGTAYGWAYVGIVRTGEKFMLSLQQGDMQSAYDLQSGYSQWLTSEEEFAQNPILRSLLHYPSHHWDIRTVYFQGMLRGEARVTIARQAGSESTGKFFFIYEDGLWKISYFEFSSLI